MNSDHIAIIATLNCMATLSNMDANHQMLDRARHDRTEKLLEEMLQQLRTLNERLDDGLQ